MLTLIRTRFFTPYNNALKSRPLLTKSLTGLTLAGSGDIIAQTIEARKGAQKSSITHNRDPFRRFIAFATFGCLWTGPFNHYWLGYLARRFPPEAGQKAFLQKMFLHHMIWNPFIYFPFLFGYNGLLLGLSKSDFEEWVKREYFSSLMWCYVVWGPTTVIVFKKVPEHLQSAFMASLSLGWNSFLSWKNNR
jgi:Mpv17 / PMP22 family